jgi:hypothetical protein
MVIAVYFLASCSRVSGKNDIVVRRKVQLKLMPMSMALGTDDADI